MQGLGITLRVPAPMLRMVTHALNVLHLTPLSGGHVELLRRDNAPHQIDDHALRHWLGRAPVNVGSCDAESIATVATALGHI